MDAVDLVEVQPLLYLYIGPSFSISCDCLSECSVLCKSATCPEPRRELFFFGPWEKQLTQRCNISVPMIKDSKFSSTRSCCALTEDEEGLSETDCRPFVQTW